MNETSIAVIGLGYVGLPLYLALAKHHPQVIGFDISDIRVEELQRGIDRNNEEELAGITTHFTASLEAIKHCSFFIVAVPTPIDTQLQPDLRILQSATRNVARVLKRGDLVVFESTVYPGVTEEICGKILEDISGLVCGRDFFLGYSPERINPGDKIHRFDSIAKIVSAQTTDALARVVAVYQPAVQAGLHLAPSIKVAEASKIVENTQRDLNIALMNEFAMIFHRMGIRTQDVLDAAATKWNFLRFTPGLVGGHCIGVDPYYLTAKAAELGYTPQVILAGRRINDAMGHYMAHQTMIALAQQMDRPLNTARVGILGLTFKENVPDIRNSKVADIYRTLQSYGITALVHDPYASSVEAKENYGIDLSDLSSFSALDALIVAVGHAEYRALPLAYFEAMLRANGVLVDVKSLFPPVLSGNRRYISL